ncbi:hypothetical protein T01_13115 [Trichinella spiralis]|uniref:Uncharacterized protein n=1 Tax=Trichinella spiralis TaxID=6334 RepID=A0A0V1C2Q5_TRISP|nr:hypothetical protein T01_13115 [Trichinella spiralis]
MTNIAQAVVQSGLGKLDMILKDELENNRSIPLFAPFFRTTTKNEENQYKPGGTFYECVFDEILPKMLHNNTILRIASRNVADSNNICT